MLASYTWSKKMDDYLWTNPYNRRFDYGLARDDVPHNFKFSNVWNVPNGPFKGIAQKLLNGWMLNSIVTWQSGFPFSITSGRDNSLTGVGRDRADYLGGVATLDSGRPHGELIAQYFNTAVFAPNAIGTFGNSGKNILRGPRYFNADFGVTKRTTLAERVALDFRAEFFNVFNNVNFSRRTPISPPASSGGSLPLSIPGSCSSASSCNSDMNDQFLFATAPVSWGVNDYPDESWSQPYETILDKIASCGYTGTELGPFGYFPIDPDVLRPVLERRGLKMLSSFVPVALPMRARRPR